MIQSIPFCVIDFSPRDRQDERGEVVGMHLRIAGHHGDHVGASAKSQPIAGRNRRADAAVHRVAFDPHSLVVRGRCNSQRPVAARVVDHDDQIDETRHARECDGDEPFLVVRGNDYRQSGSLQHPRKS